MERRVFLAIAFLLVLIIGVYVPAVAATIEETKALAAQDALTRYSEKLDEVAIFMGNNPIRKSDSALILNTTNKSLVLQYDSAIVTFVDLMPGADWGHPCEYIFTDIITNQQYVYSTDFPLRTYDLVYMERLNETTEMEILNELNNTEINNLITRIQGMPKPSKTDGNKYAILIAGGVARAGNFEKYYNTIKLMYNALVYIYAYPEDHIFVYFAGGAINPDDSYDDSNPNTHVIDGSDIEFNDAGNWDNLVPVHRTSDLDGDGDCDITDAATIEHVEYLIDHELKTGLGTGTSDKSLFIYTYDHGGPPGATTNDVFLCMWEDNWDDNDFVEKLDMAPYQNLKDLIVSMHQCNSGGFQNDFENSDLKHLVFMASASYYESGYSGSNLKYAQLWVRGALGEDFEQIDVNDNSELEVEEIYNYALTNMDNLDPADDQPPQNTFSRLQHPHIYSKDPSTQATTSTLGDYAPYEYYVGGALNCQDNGGVPNEIYGAEVRLFRNDPDAGEIECGSGVHYSHVDGQYIIATNYDENVFIKVKTQNEFIRVIEDAGDVLISDIFEYNSPEITTALGYNELNYYILNTEDNFQAVILFNIIARSQDWYHDNLHWERYRSSPPLYNPIPDRIDVVWLGSEIKDLIPGFNIENDYIGIEDVNLEATTYINYHYSLANIYNAYDYSFPFSLFEGETGLNRITDEGMALRNGIAWFLTASIANDPNAVRLGFGQNIEANTWWQGEDGTNTNGRIVEGAIASFFWDLYDAENEEDDNLSGYLFEIWQIITEYKPQTIGEFMAYWRWGNYDDFIKIARINHLLLDENVHITRPTEGEPLIVGLSELDPVIIEASVTDVSGNFVTDMAIEDFTVLIGGNSCIINQVQYQTNRYFLQVIPPTQSSTGLYDLEIIINGNEEYSSSDVVLGGVLYTVNAVIERGLAYLKSVQSITSKGEAYVSEQGGSIDEEGIDGTRDLSDPRDEKGSWAYRSSPNAGITALALQAFLAQGYGIDDPVYGATIERAINYLLDVQTQFGNQTGAIYNNTQGYETAMAIVALKSAQKTGLPEPLNTNVQTALDKALNYFTQDVQSSWERVSWRYNRGYTSQDDGDMSVNQWVYLALDAMDYTDKDIWNKIYGYINRWKVGTSDGSAIYYYRSSGSRPRGNTLAGIWGLVLSGNNGVTGAPGLAQSMYNYIDDMCPVNTLISHPSLHSSVVYEGAGYYYYIYEFAKALALGGKTQFCNENWYQILASRIDGQHQTDANGNYYWKVGWTDPSGYYIPSSSIQMGYSAHTALALLSLQVGTVPPDSKVRFRLVADKGVDGLDEPEGLFLKVYDSFGDSACIGDDGTWLTTIANSQWAGTLDNQELEINLSSTAVNFTFELINNQNVDAGYFLEIEAYQGDNPNPVDYESFSGIVPQGLIYGSSAYINSIVVLSIFVPEPPHPIPLMAITPSSIDLGYLFNDSTYSFQFYISEESDSASLQNIDIYLTDFEDEYGNVIPASCFTLNPESIGMIPAGGSSLVQGVLVMPDTSVLDIRNCGNFAGAIISEALGKTKRAGLIGAAAKYGEVVVNVVESGRGMAGVPIDLWRGDSLLTSLHTEINGCCSIDSVLIGDYKVSIIPPLGYVPDYSDISVLVKPGCADTVVFPVSRMMIVPSQWPSSKWMHVAAVAYFGIDSEEEDALEPVRLATYCDMIYNHFQKNPIHPINIYGDYYPLHAAGKLFRLMQLLGMDVTTDRIIRPDVDVQIGTNSKLRPDSEYYYRILAVRELTTLLLNVVSNKIATFSAASVDSISVGQVITYSSELIYDDNNDNDEQIYMMLKGLNFGNMLEAGVIPASTPNIAYMEYSAEELPQKFYLAQNRPNPFNPKTTFEFALPTASDVRLDIYNILGQKVITLIDDHYEAGRHTAQWDSKDNYGRLVSSGIYIYQLRAGEFTDQKKMLLLK